MLRKISLSNWIMWTAALHVAWFPALFIAWMFIAGQYGNPVPDNWPALERTMGILVMSAKVSWLLFVLTPVAWYATYRRSRWALSYPIALLLACIGTVALCLLELTQAPPRPAFVAPPHHRCWRFGREIPPVDAVGKMIRPGDLVVIRSGVGSDALLPDTPEQAKEREAWNGVVAMIDGSIEGGALRFHRIGVAPAWERPQFCLWPDNVRHLRTH
jgi:hypothetical protein